MQKLKNFEHRPQYRQVADVIRADVEAGTYPRGSQMPGERELAARYGVTHSVINRALQVLRGEDILRAEVGRGTYVRGVPVIHSARMIRYVRELRESGGARGAFDYEIRQLGMEPRSDVTVSRISPPLRIADVLGTDDVILRDRRMWADDVPVQFAPGYVPWDIAGGTQIEQRDSGPGGIISRLAELGYPQVKITESVRVRRAEDDERKFLRLEKDMPVIEVFHVGWAASGRAIEVSLNVQPAYLWVNEYEWRIDT